MRRVLRWVGLLLVVGLAFGVGWAWPILVRPPLVLGQDAISDAATRSVPRRATNISQCSGIVCAISAQKARLR